MCVGKIHCDPQELSFGFAKLYIYNQNRCRVKRLTQDFLLCVDQVKDHHAEPRRPSVAREESEGSLGGIA